jgi:hypothetical protein
LAKRCDGAVDCSDGSDEDLTHAGCVTTCSGAGKQSEIYLLGWNKDLLRRIHLFLVEIWVLGCR